MISAINTGNKIGPNMMSMEMISQNQNIMVNINVNILVNRMSGMILSLDIF